jgi:hypothetical protein
MGAGDCNLKAHMRHIPFTIVNSDHSLLKASKSLLSISNSANISFAKVYHVNMPLSCIDLFRLNVSFIRGLVWFMENYLSIYKSVNRSRSHGTTCDTLSLGDKFCFEKIHHKVGIRKIIVFFDLSVLAKNYFFEQHKM